MRNDQSDGAMVPMPDSGGNPLAPSQGTQGFWTSLMSKSDDDKRLLLSALQGKQESLGDHLGKAIPVTNVLVKMVELENDETGEVSRVPRLTLIGPNGEMHACTSDYAWESMKQIMSPQLYGPPPWVPALLIECQQQQTARKRRLFTLSVSGRAKK